MTLVIHQAGQPVFIRTIASIGGSAATKAVADSLRMDTERAEALKISTGSTGHRSSPRWSSQPSSAHQRHRALRKTRRHHSSVGLWAPPS